MHTCTMTNDERDTRWPNVPRICFGPGEPRQLNAHVDWVLSGEHGMHGYVEGYQRAASAVYDDAIRTRSNPAYALFPLAFLWRHHLELSLKEIIAMGRAIDGEPWNFPATHRLLDLWTEAKPHIQKVGSLDAPEVGVVETNLGEFEAIDPGSFGFRYPTERNSGDRTLSGAPATMNLRVLHEAMEAVSSFLSAVRMGLSVHLDYARMPP